MRQTMMPNAVGVQLADTERRRCGGGPQSASSPMEKGKGDERRGCHVQTPEHLMMMRMMLKRKDLVKGLKEGKYRGWH